MVIGWTGRCLGLALSVFAVCGVSSQVSQANARGTHYSVHETSRGARYPVPRFASWHGSYGRHVHHGYTSLRRWASSGLQCVPFARENTGIELSGNAGTWWDKADGLYERGAKPEVGSILNFRATGHMRMGHVAVVTNVLDGRHVQIDHANWASPGRISRDIDVVDVSPANDWTAVRVELEYSNEFGSIYPTYGFIYDRPDSGTMLANNGVVPAPVLNAAPADLRPASDRIEQPAIPTAPEEVAEAADDGDDTMAGSTHWSHRWSRYHGHASMGHSSPSHLGLGHASLRHAAAYSNFHPQFAKSATVYRVVSRGPAPLSIGHHRHRF